MAVRPSSSDQPYSFLDLPFEIRTMIYKELFVVQKLLCNYDEGTPQRLRRSADVGCVVIATLDPTKYDSLFMTRSSFPVKRSIHSREWQTTTYFCKSGIDLCLLATNRQIYEESSEIFYSQNMFFFNDLSVATPFLKDRSTRSKSFMRKLSVQYPRPKALEHPLAFHDSPLHAEITWEEICCYVSLHMQGLAQLDLRVDRGGCCLFNAGVLDYKDADFPAKQRKDLATLGQGTTLTESGIEWCGWRNDENMRHANLFAPLEPWLRESIAQIRAKHFSQKERLLRQNALERFWQAHRKQRNDQAYQISCRTFEIDRRRGVLSELGIESDNGGLIDFTAAIDSWKDDGHLGYER